MTIGGRAAALLGAAALLLAGTPVGIAAADPLSSCTRTGGTIVAVDFSAWDGPLVRGCSTDSPTGYDLLHDAGFTTAGTSHDGPAFICRLGNAAFDDGAQRPTTDEDACVLTPPASAYWSYWLAPAGQHTWSYSQLGAMSDVPKDGEVQLWIFGGTNVEGTTGSGVPSYGPDSLRPGGASAPSTSRSSAHPTAHPTSSSAHSSAPTTIRPPASTSATTRSATSQPTVTRTTAPSSSASSRPRHRSGDAAPRSTGAPPTASGDGAQGAPQVSASGSAPAIVDARPTAQDTSAGSAIPLVGGLGLAALLGGGALLAVRRRRSEP